ncbi:peptidylprolyl isomerase [soil metagenome]
MTVATNKVVSILYTLTGVEGELIDSNTAEGDAPLEYLHGADNVVPGLEAALEGKAPGDKVAVRVPPDAGYGEREEDLVTEVPRSQLEELGELEVGVQFRAETDEGVEIFTVTEVGDDLVTIDGNHPLAGAVLNFEVEVVAVRDATDEELEHGHAHGLGCQHDH